MKDNMKVFFSTLIGLIAIIILAAVIVGFIFWSRVPDMLANNLSKKMKVSVAIDSIGLGWGKIDLKKIEIGNPTHSILSKAFSCNEINVSAPFTRYLDKHIVIDEIDLNDVYLGLEFDSANSTKGNWTTIMNNIQSTTAVGQVTKKKKEAAPEGEQRSVLIHRVILTNINVDVVYKKDHGKVKKLPTIPRMELTEISSEGGLPMDQITNSVLGEMLKQVFIKENLKNMLQELMNQPANPIQQFLSPFKGLFSEVGEEVIGQ
jgi:uncharacterized protein involved in outer membrane biogenesis